MNQPPSIRHRFGELRSLLHGGPGEEPWAALCKLLDLWEHHEELEPVALPYIRGVIHAWPDELCAAPARWLERMLREDEPAMPQWAVVRALDCHGQMFGHMTWRHIGRTLIDERVRTLRARALPLTSRELDLLLESPSALQLKHLDLTHSPLSLDAVESLAACAQLRPLRRLDIGECRLGHVGVQLLCMSPFLGSLESLKLQNDRIGMGSMDLLTRAEFAPNLRHLDLSDNHLGRRGAELLGQPHVWQRLESLRLKNCGLGPDGVRALFAHAQAFPMLKKLNLEHNDLQGMGLRWLVESPVMPQLRSLNVGYNKIGGDGLKRLLHDERSRGLRHLAIHWNPVSPTAQDVLASSPYLSVDDLTLCT